jgi:hypothetical protein
VFYLQTTAPPAATKAEETDVEEEEEGEEEAPEREDYDEKYTFTQTEYWECSHLSPALECYGSLPVPSPAHRHAIVLWG